MTSMISPRAPRDGDLPRTVVLPSACRAIGAQLAAAREAQQLSIEAIASKLLLSRGQVLGLEQAEPAAFYNVRFFLRGLRKYMAFMGLPPALLDDDEEEEGGMRLMLADMGAARESAFTSRQTPTLAATAAALLVLTASALYVSRVAWAWWSGDAPDTIALTVETPLPAAPLIEPVVASPSVQAEPASAVLAGTDPDSTVRVSVGKPTWVFIRYPDNRVVDRKLAAGEELEVGPLPVFLAVGTADSVEVRVENRPVALGPYIRNGQVRMTRPDLAKLVP
jgi:transcriptional regulator with XRE-family HTH domain